MSTSTSKRTTPVSTKNAGDTNRKQNDRSKMTTQLSSLKTSKQKRSSRKNLHSPPRSESAQSIVESRPSLSASSRNSLPFDQIQDVDDLVYSSTPREVMAAVVTPDDQSLSTPTMDETTSGTYPQSFDDSVEEEQQEHVRVSQPIAAAGGYNLDDLPDAVAPSDTGPRQACPDCGRKFIAEAMVKHRRICRKVFGQKRKPMDMKKKLYDKDALQAKRKSDGGRGRGRAGRGRGGRGGRAIQPAAKSAKWKNQSSSLRQAIRAARMGAAAPFQPTPEDLDTRIPCPHCGRKFAEATAERHIPKCKNIKAKPTTLRRKR